MVLETGIPDFWVWLLGPGGIRNSLSEPGALATWSLSMVLLFVFGLLISWLVSVIFRGPTRGTKVVFGRLMDATRDLFSISPRRVISLTILCFREAFRRWAWVAIVIYLILLAFAGFFLDPRTNEPAELYLDFVMTSAAFLVAMIVLFLSVFSIPNDISRRTIYTVVTKPVRASEMILGRIFGFSAVATLLLIGMGLVSYLFVNRAIDHVHTLDPTQLEWEYVQDADGKHPVLVGSSEYAADHRHDTRVVFKQAGGVWQAGVTETMHGHNHNINPQLEVIEVNSANGTDGIDYNLIIAEHDLRVGDKCLASDGDALSPEGYTVTAVNGDAVTIRNGSNEAQRNIATNEIVLDQVVMGSQPRLHKISLPLTSPQGLLTARVPIYSSDFYFIDSAQQEKRAGINVGNVWEYRSYVEGGSRYAAVIWVFDGVSAESFPIEEYPNGLPLEFTLSIFRTHKGDIEEGVLGSLKVINPETNRSSSSVNFAAKEFTINTHTLPRIIEAPPAQNQAGTPMPVDLFEEFVYDGDKLMVELKCLERGQYFGVARPDLYIATADASFALNYLKGFFSIYLQVLVITSFGVMFSTFLNGAMSLVATFIVGVIGIFGDMIRELIGDEKPPGGLLFESFYRMINRTPMTTKLDPGWIPSAMVAADDLVKHYLRLTYQVFPDLMTLWDKDYVSNGFNIPMDRLGIQVMTTLGFFIPLFVLSHFILKCREVAK